jgi:hypothetical protein
MRLAAKERTHSGLPAHPGTRVIASASPVETSTLEPVSGNASYRTKSPVKEKVPPEHKEAEHGLIQESSWVCEAHYRGWPEEQNNSWIRGLEDGDQDRHHKAYTACP